LPEFVVGVFVVTGWTLYRKSQGKPITPDEALVSQDAYRRQQEELRRRNERWTANSRSSSSNSAHELARGDQ